MEEVIFKSYTVINALNKIELKTKIVCDPLRDTLLKRARRLYDSSRFK